MVPSGVGGPYVPRRRVSGRPKETGTHVESTPGSVTHYGRTGPTLVHTDYLTTRRVDGSQFTRHKPAENTINFTPQGEGGYPTYPLTVCTKGLLKTFILKKKR